MRYIGIFTDYQATLGVLEEDKKEGYILDYRIEEREDGGFDVYTQWNSNRLNNQVQHE